jgi:hypothetical protein
MKISVLQKYLFLNVKYNILNNHDALQYQNQILLNHLFLTMFR